MRPLVTAVLLIATLSSFSLAPDNARNTRELDWDTCLDKVQGAWMGKMIGVTFGQPWEFQYQNTPNRLRYHRLAALADPHERLSKSRSEQS
jgi:hypothetical protein